MKKLTLEEIFREDPPESKSTPKWGKRVPTDKLVKCSDGQPRRVYCVKPKDSSSIRRYYILAHGMEVDLDFAQLIGLASKEPHRLVLSPCAWYRWDH